jgi:hypothetical protein
MTAQNVEKVYEKYAWILIFVIGVLTFLTGFVHAFGINTDPASAESIVGMTLSELKTSNPSFFNLYNFYFRFGGLSDLGFAFFIIVISATAYRMGKRWAWYAFWFIPAFFLGSAGIAMSVGPSIPDLLPFITLFVILSLLGLLLPFRKFFPKGDKTK